MGPTLRAAILFAGALAFATALPARAGETNVAVAANFTDAANELAQVFKEKTGHEAILSFGSTGQLYTQITQDAPSRSSSRPTTSGPGRRSRRDSPFREASSPTRSERSCCGARTRTWCRASRPEGRRLHQDRHRQPGAAPCGAAAVQTMKGARRVRSARAQDRAGQQHQPDLPVRGDRQRRARLHRAGAGGAQRRWIALDRAGGPARCHPAGCRAAPEGRGQRRGQGVHRLPEGPDAAPIIAKYGYGTAAAS